MSIGKVIYNELLMFPDKELLSSKERLELEVTSLRTSLQEQQSKMDILDNALTNAQGNVVRLEEEVGPATVVVAIYSGDFLIAYQRIF